MEEPRRRRSPGWVRAFSDRALHGLLFKMHRQRQSGDLTDAQEWLWDAGISELEYRARNTTGFRRCVCELCLEPFPDFEDF